MDPDGNTIFGFLAGMIAGALGFGQLYSTLTMVIGIARSIQAIANGADPKAVIGSWLLGYAISAVINPIVNGVLKGISGSGKSNNFEQKTTNGTITGVRDNVYVNDHTGLKVNGNNLEGGATYYCNGSAAFCNKKVPYALSKLKSFSSGGYKMEYNMLRVDSRNQADLLILESPLKSTKLNAVGEYCCGDGVHRNIIRIKPNYRGNFGRVLRHEIGHWMGLGHQLIAGSLMSYHPLAPSRFSGIDLGRLAHAY